MLVADVTEERGNVQIGDDDAHRTSLPHTISLRNDCSVRASNSHVPVQVAVEKVELVRNGFGEARLTKETSDQVWVEPIEELFVIYKRCNNRLSFQIRFFDLGLEVPCVGNVLSLPPSSLLGLVQPAFLPLFHSVPHHSVDQTVKHAEDCDASVVAGGECMSFRQHWQWNVEVGIGENTFLFCQVLNLRAVLPSLHW